ncbi:hypothetical protein SUGI_0353620 [Cryptomeria japonica]|nr:hypothetical protein SUGI_0353620 [Cryptomeria japonica]
MNVMKDLQQLLLDRLSVPSWICGMVHLTELTLIKCTDYTLLKYMPNIQSLVLCSDSRCKELLEKFGERGGPKLVRLLIAEFPIWKELPALEEGAMQRLEMLKKIDCPQVKKVPKGLELLTRLKGIAVHEASGELKESLKAGGEDWNKIKAENPNIKIKFL